MLNKISKVNAKDGGLEFELSNGKVLEVFKDPFKIKYTIVSYGILDNVKGKSLPITFLTVFNDSSQVYHSEIIKYREAYGGEVGSRSWLNQFNLYTDKSKYKVGDDISGITGATISVHSISKGIRKLSYLINEIIENDK